MPLRVLAPMQDADDFYRICGDSIKQGVTFKRQASGPGQ